MNYVVDFYCPAYKLAIEIHVAYRGRLARSSGAAGSAAVHGVIQWRLVSGRPLLLHLQKIEVRRNPDGSTAQEGDLD